MAWHFPHGDSNESTIIQNSYKLIRNYDHIDNPENPPIELFQLYKNGEKKDQRIDIEEAKNLATAMSEKVKSMDDQLTATLAEMKSSHSSYNPDFRGKLPHQEKTPTITDVTESKGTITVTAKENGAVIKKAHLIYPQWRRHRRRMVPSPLVKADVATYSTELPKGTTHYFINLIDDEQTPP